MLVSAPKIPTRGSPFWHGRDGQVIIERVKRRILGDPEEEHPKWLLEQARKAKKPKSR